MRHFLEIAHALSDEMRVRVLFLLRGHSEGLPEAFILETLDLPRVRLQREVEVLFRVGLVDYYTLEGLRYYTLSIEGSLLLIEGAYLFLFQSLESNAMVRKDQIKLQQVFQNAQTRRTASRRLGDVVRLSDATISSDSCHYGFSKLVSRVSENSSFSSDTSEAIVWRER